MTIGAEAWTTFLHLLRIGSFVDTALSTAGIGRKIYRSQMAAGREALERGDLEYPSATFVRDVDAGLGKAEMMCVGTIVSAAASGDWRAALTVLERR